MYLRSFHRCLILLTILGMLAGCRLGATPPAISDIQAQPSTTIMTGEEASLTISVTGNYLEIEWIAQKGTLSDSAQPAVIYTAPDSPGSDIVTVKVKYSGGEVIRNEYFDVVAPTPTPPPPPTDTPVPTDSPTATPLPGPTSCNNFAVTSNVFPQLANVDGQLPFYGPVNDPDFICEGVYDLTHTGQLAVRIDFELVGDNSGYWGIGTPNGYDASSFREICFWAYAQEPNRPFYLRMKDISGLERNVKVLVVGANEWEQICAPLTEFSDQNVQLDQMENVNLGFNSDNGSVVVWVDDFEFRR